MRESPKSPGPAWVGVTTTRLATAFLAVLVALPAFARDRALESWGTNATVFAQARSGNTLYIAGDFGAVGPNTGGGVPLHPRTGAPVRGFPRVCGSVSVAVPDGSGGWFIGGSFTAVEGAPRTSIAHVRANGRLSTWSPDVEGSQVFAIVRRGRCLFVGGTFTSVNGSPRRNLAALDAVTGAVLDWNPDVDRTVRCLLIHDGALYVGGAFTTVGGQARANLARVDAASGAVDAWQGGIDGQVFTLARLEHTLFVGGEFDHAGGTSRNSIAQLDLRTGLATDWDMRLGPGRLILPHGNYIWPYVASIIVRHRTLYVGGWFTSAGGEPRAAVAAVDAHSARPRSFDARLGGQRDVVTAMAVRGNAVYLGGGFGSAGGEPRINLAAFDARTGEVLPWDPRAAEQAYARIYPRPGHPRIGGVIDALVAGDDEIYAGGRFTSMYEWKQRSFLAALDLTTGRATDWAPRAEGIAVTALAVRDQRVYLSGLFRAIDGVHRDNLAAVDATDGTLLDWGPAPAAAGLASLATPGNQELATYSFYASRLAIREDVVYAAGGFVESITSRERFHVAAFDASTGHLLPWNPRADGPISGMLQSGNTIYLGGIFANLGGVRRSWLGSVDASSATALPWDPRPRPEPVYGFPPRVQAMACSRGSVFLGGEFVSMGGETRRYLAAVDTLNGEILPWNPESDGSVFALATAGHAVWVGGAFSRVAGEPQPFLGALDAVSGRLLGEQPRLDGNVRSLLIDGRDVFVAGEFRSLDRIPSCGIARIREPRADDVDSVPSDGEASGPPAVHFVSAMHAPFDGQLRLTFTTTRAGGVSLSAFDVQGRRVARILNGESLGPGAHTVSLRTKDLRAGVYLIQLTAEGHSVASKLVVMH